MLFAVGMYLPFATTFAIFCGGVIRWIGESFARSKQFNDAQMARVENAGILTASGLIAGEALVGLVWSALQFAPEGWIPDFGNHSYAAGAVVLVGLGILMVKLPVSNAGSPDEQAPPAAMM